MLPAQEGVKLLKAVTMRLLVIDLTMTTFVVWDAGALNSMGEFMCDQGSNAIAPVVRREAPDRRFFLKALVFGVSE